jgi:hypothetical protein
LTDARCYGMEMNVERAKVLRIQRLSFPAQIMMDRKQLKNREYFKYPDSLILMQAIHVELNRILP